MLSDHWNSLPSPALLVLSISSPTGVYPNPVGLSFSNLLNQKYVRGGFQRSPSKTRETTLKKVLRKIEYHIAPLVISCIILWILYSSSLSVYYWKQSDSVIRFGLSISTYVADILMDIGRSNRTNVHNYIYIN